MTKSQEGIGWKVPLFDLDYGEEEKNALLSVYESKWLTMGEKTQKFEQAFSGHLGQGYQCLAVSNCTSALYMALIACGVKEGDEVLIPSLTFVADANVVTMLGAIPVQVDCVSLDDWNMDPADLESKISSSSKAVIALHYGGYACDIESIAAICRKHSLYLIEDMAHAPGALSDKGSLCGTLGDVSCYSFFSNKNIAVGEGGMYATSSPELFDKGRILRSHGMSTLTLDRHKGRAVSYDVQSCGLNFRIDEFRSALGLVQLAKLSVNNDSRQRLTAFYREKLKETDISIPFSKIALKNSSCHILPVLLPEAVDRLKVIASLKERQIQSSIHYPAFIDFTAYKDIKGRAPVAESICARELTLPLYPSMREEQVDLVCEALLEAIKQT